MQLGVLVVSMLLIVFMIMESRHLSRNHLLFFCSASFVTLAVVVYLSPSLTSFVLFDHYRDSCTDFVNEIVWDFKPKTDGFLDVKNATSESYDKNWNWVRSGKVSACDFRKFSKSDVSHLLNGLQVVVAGDSEAQLFVVSLLHLVLDKEHMDSMSGDWFKRQSDYKLVIDEIDMTLDFIWAPYESNLTNFIKQYKDKRSCPDVLVMGSGLWHLLHVNNASDYGSHLQLLRNSVLSVLPCFEGPGINHTVTYSALIRSAHLFWLGMPVLVNEMLNQAKREKVIDGMCYAYERAVEESKLLQQAGGPFVLLDIKSLTQNCGSTCTIDGIHYDTAVYDALVHIMLNALLIETQQLGSWKQ